MKQQQQHSCSRSVFSDSVRGGVLKAQEVQEPPRSGHGAGPRNGAGCPGEARRGAGGDRDRVGLLFQRVHIPWLPTG